MNRATDSYSRNLQNQIADAQKQLQELSSNKDMTQEEKIDAEYGDEDLFIQAWRDGLE